MPELPEVETNARNLARWSLGRRVVKVVPPEPGRTLADPDALVRVARRRRIEEVARRGKWMLVRLDDGGGLGLHLGMTGKIARAARGEELPRFTRAVLGLDDGTRICFVDARRFGTIVAEASHAALLARPDIAGLGPDALSRAATAALAAGLGRSGRTVKEVLLDQRVLAGVGNLYATEALLRAGIHPAASARAVADDRAAVLRLARSIRVALRHGLRTMASEAPPVYLEEGAPNPFLAYDRKGERCRRCRSDTIRAITLGGRTSAFCPTCQPPPRPPRTPKLRGR